MDYTLYQLWYIYCIVRANNIVASNLEFDFITMNFDFTKSSSAESTAPVLMINLPKLKHWGLSFDLVIERWWKKPTYHTQFTFNEINITLATSLTADSNGQFLF